MKSDEARDLYTKLVSIYALLMTVIMMALAVQNLNLKNKFKGNGEVSDAYPKTDHMPYWGPAAAPVEIVVFSSVGCESCDRLTMFLDRIMVAQPAVMQVFFNFLPTNSLQEQGALACLAGHRQSQFREVLVPLSWFFGKYTQAEIHGIAGSLALDIKKFDLDLSSPQLRADLQVHEAEAVRLGISVLPTVFINGMRIDGTEVEDIKRSLATLGIIN